jgi:UDP-glucose 4-epimerase
VVPALIRLVSTDAAVGLAVNLGSSEQVSIGELARRVIDATGSCSIMEQTSYLEAYGTGYEDMQRRVPNCDLARDLVGFVATKSLDEIIQAVMADQQSALAATAAV